MQEFLSAGATKEDLLSLNRCRLHRKAYFLSDITNGYGTMITDDAWMVRVHSLPQQTSWPKQALLLRHDWTTWRNFIKHYSLSRGMHLRSPLGKWLDFHDKWSWYYSRDYDCLYYISGGSYKEFSWIPQCSRSCFQIKGFKQILP